MTPLLSGAAAAVAVLALPGRRPSPVGRLRSVLPAAQEVPRRSPPALLVLAVAAAVAVIATGWVLPVAAAAGTAAVAGRLWARSCRRRRARQRETAAVEVVFALAAELRAGHPPARALEAVAQTAGPLRAVLSEIATAARSGAPVAAELGGLAVIPGCSAFAAVAACWEVTEQAGGPVAVVLENLGRSLDEEEQHRQALAALLAGPRTTMLLLAALPGVGVVLGQSTGARSLHLLLHTPLGWGLTGGALTLDLAGLAWTSWLTGSALRS